MLAQLNAKVKLTPCGCRRHLRKNIKGQALCPRCPIAGRLAIVRSRRKPTMAIGSLNRSHATPAISYVSIRAFRAKAAWLERQRA